MEKNLWTLHYIFLKLFKEHTSESSSSFSSTSFFFTILGVAGLTEAGICQKIKLYKIKRKSLQRNSVDNYWYSSLSNQIIKYIQLAHADWPCSPLLPLGPSLNLWIPPAHSHLTSLPLPPKADPIYIYFYIYIKMGQISATNESPHWEKRCVWCVRCVFCIQRAHTEEMGVSAYVYIKRQVKYLPRMSLGSRR